MMVVISNGFNKFVLAIAAEEANRRGTLVHLITGAYPTRFITAVLGVLGLSTARKFGRLLQRAHEIPENKITSLFAAELIFQIAMLLRRFRPMYKLSEWLDLSSFRLYKRAACRIMRRIGPEARIYHYRAGFGGRSAQIARANGMVLLCDHTIAHPSLLEYLVENDGKFPLHPISPKSPLWCEILKDIEQADHVRVNSEFVRETFIFMGWDRSRIHPIQLGIDNQFLDALPIRKFRTVNQNDPLRLMFAGSFERRKGAHVLMAALAQLNDFNWEFHIAGSVESGIFSDHMKFFDAPRVHLLGTLSRMELAQEMTKTDIFVYPTLADDAARAITEALAAGCYVITTPNSGSIVQHGVNGAIVPPGDASALAVAIRRAGADRQKLASIAQANANLIRRRYRQCDYGDSLAALYAQLLTVTSGNNVKHDDTSMRRI